MTFGIAYLGCLYSMRLGHVYQLGSFFGLFRGQTAQNRGTNGDDLHITAPLSISQQALGEAGFLRMLGIREQNLDRIFTTSGE